MGPRWRIRWCLDGEDYGDVDWWSRLKGSLEDAVKEGLTCYHYTTSTEYGVPKNNRIIE